MATVKLSQDRVYAGPARFSVYEKVVSGDPSVVRTPFLIETIQVTANQDGERLIRIATVEDLVFGDGDGKYEINPLTYFIDPTGKLHRNAQPNDKVRIGSVMRLPPAEWGPVPQSGSFDFAIKTIDAARLGVEVTEPFRWCKPKSVVGGDKGVGMYWQLVRFNPDTRVYDPVPNVEGYDGYVERKKVTSRPFLDDRFTSNYTTGGEALAHIAAAQYWFEELCSAAGLDGTSYLSYNSEWSNPIVSNITGTATSSEVVTVPATDLVATMQALIDYLRPYALANNNQAALDEIDSANALLLRAQGQ